MQLFALSLSLLFAALCSAQAPSSTATAAPTTHTVTVGGVGQLAFDPSFLTVASGDILAFEFVGGNHSVTQSTFAEPCTPLSGGVNSGFMPGAGSGPSPTYRFQVANASGPFWFFCAQTGHCERGMVFAINPTAEKTFDAFKTTALGNYSYTPPPNAAPARARAGLGAAGLAVLAGLLVL